MLHFLQSRSEESERFSPVSNPRSSTIHYYPFLKNRHLTLGVHLLCVFSWEDITQVNSSQIGSSQQMKEQTPPIFSLVNQWVLLKLFIGKWVRGYLKQQKWPNSCWSPRPTLARMAAPPNPESWHTVHSLSTAQRVGNEFLMKWLWLAHWKINLKASEGSFTHVFVAETQVYCSVTLLILMFLVKKVPCCTLFAKSASIPFEDFYQSLLWHFFPSIFCPLLLI